MKPHAYSYKAPFLLPFIFLMHVAFGEQGIQAEKITGSKDYVADSLKTLLQKSEEDTGKAGLLFQLGNHYLYTDKNEALVHLTSALHLAEKLAHKKVQAWSLNHLGIISKDRGNYLQSLEYYIRAARINMEMRDTVGLTMNYLNLGVIHKKQGNFQEALKYYFKSLHLAGLQNKKKSMATSYNNIGAVYSLLDSSHKSLEYFFKALKISDEEGDKKNVAAATVNIGETYYKKSLSSGSGERFGKYSRNDITNAEEYFLKAFEIFNELGHKQAVAYTNIQLAKIYLFTGRNGLATETIKKAIAIAAESGFKEELQNAYLCLSEIKEAQGDFKEAFEYYKQFSQVKDSILNLRTGEKIAEFEAKFETSQKEKEIEILNNDKKLQLVENKKQRIIIYSSAGGFTLMFVLAFFIYKGYAQKQRANVLLEEKNKVIETKNAEVEKQRNNILDSINYAQRIQQSILLPEEELHKHLPDSFIFFHPKDIVSGDFYWFSKVDGKIIIAAVDCTGHGVPGAFMSMIASILMNEIINDKKITTPAVILGELNNAVRHVLQQEKGDTFSQDGMDMALCTIDYPNNTLQYAGAKNPVCIVKNGALTIIKGDSFSIGGKKLKFETSDERAYKNHEMPIDKKMCIYIFSDGYVDQFGGLQRQKFGSLRLRQLLSENHYFNMQQQKMKLSKIMSEWKKNYDQLDDMLVMGIKL